MNWTQGKAGWMKSGATGILPAYELDSRQSQGFSHQFRGEILPAYELDSRQSDCVRYGWTALILPAYELDSRQSRRKKGG